MKIGFNVKGLKCQAKINGRLISSSDCFFTFTRFENKHYRLAISFEDTGQDNAYFRKRYWLNAELSNSVIHSPTITKPINDLEYVGSLQLEIGAGAETRRQSRYFSNIEFDFTSMNDSHFLTASGKTLEEYSSGDECWDYSISVELKKEIVDILTSVTNFDTGNSL